MANTEGPRPKRTPSAATIEKQVKARGMRGFFQHLRACVVLFLVLVLTVSVHLSDLAVAVIAAVFASNVVLGAIDLIAWKGWGEKK